uniref:ATP-dependent DNA helicase n=1 Tax=Brassica oleracea TaxID=3712 RepID=A0A3P6C4G0_BRAOL|nr:unnamed protein product [Brassica oleracea]
MCDIHRGSMLASSIAKSDLIIWDEAPMKHRQAFETLDRSLRDLLSPSNPEAADRLFGGKTVLLGRDFRKILPVVPHGKRQDTVFASVGKSYLWKNAEKYLAERAVLTPTNSTVHELKSYMLSHVPSQAKEYLSSDSVELEATLDDDWTSHYPQKYLNSLEFPGLPNHILCLKVGPVMILRNLNQTYGLCNGTRVIVTRLGNRIVEAEIMTRKDSGERILIPRIQLSPLI